MERIEESREDSCRHTHHHRRNLIVLSITFCFIQSSYRAIEDLQSSLNVEGHLGLTSLSLIYFLFAFSGLGAVVFIGYLGTKWTVVLADFFICLYIGSNFAPKYSTIIPTSILVGFWVGPMHAAATKHRTITGHDYASIKRLDTDSVVDRFTGIFFFFVVLSTIPGNIISSVLLSFGEPYNPSNVTLAQCGANSCGNFESLQPPDQQHRQLLLGILLAIAFMGALIAVSMIDHLTEYCEYEPKRKPLVKHLGSVLDLLTSQEFLMLVPLMSFNGFEMGFAYGTFTKAYISCFRGIGAVGYVMCAFGAGGIVCAIVTAMVARFTGRGRVFALTAAFFVQVGLLCCMLLWEPRNGQDWHLYLMALCLGVGISLRLFQIRVSLGVFFPEDREATMAAFQFFHSLSFAFSTALSTAKTLCVSHMIYLQIAWLTVAMVIYFLVEWRLREDLAAKQAAAARKGSQQGMLRLRVRDLGDGKRKISIIDSGC